MVTPLPTSLLPVKTSARATVLVTGFDAFGTHAVNPSTLVAQALHQRQIAGCRVIAAELPTVFGLCFERLDALLARHQPMLVVCLGLAARCEALRLERVALNREDARIPDNQGAQPQDRPVIPGAPAAYLSSLPIDAMARSMAAAGVPVQTSQNAGTFVCNHLFFGLMHRLASIPALQGARGGFIHLPQLPDQGMPHMPFAQMVHGVRTGIRCALAATTAQAKTRARRAQR